MDPVTHALMGAAAEQAGLRQKIGRDALLAGAVAGSIVDLDIFIPAILKLTGNAGPLDLFVYHRGLTHSFVFAPLVAFVCSVVWCWLRKIVSGRRIANGKTALKEVSFLWLFVACLIPVILHVLLDACTSYGTQLYWPFSPKRVAWDCIAIIDIFFMAIPALVLIVCWLVEKLVKNAGRAFRMTRLIGIFGLVLMAGYLVGGRMMHDMAIKSAEKTCGVKQVCRAGAYPMIGTPLVWRAVLECENEWYVCGVDLLDSSKNVMTSVKKQKSPYIDLARKDLTLDTFSWFANKMLRAEVSYDGPWVYVDFHDMRYGWPAESKQSLWTFRFVFDRQGKLVRTERLGSKNRRRIRRQVINRILGKSAE